MVLPVKPTPTRSQLNILYIPLDSTTLCSMPTVWRQVVSSHWWQGSSYRTQVIKFMVLTVFSIDLLSWLAGLSIQDEAMDVAWSTSVI